MTTCDTGGASVSLTDFPFPWNSPGAERKEQTAVSPESFRIGGSYFTGVLPPPSQTPITVVICIVKTIPYWVLVNTQKVASFRAAYSPSPAPGQFVCSLAPPAGTSKSPAYMHMPLEAQRQTQRVGGGKKHRILRWGTLGRDRNFKMNLFIYWKENQVLGAPSITRCGV